MSERIITLTPYRPRLFEGGETCHTLTRWGLLVVGELERGWHWCDTYGDVSEHKTHAEANRAALAARNHDLGLED